MAITYVYVHSQHCMLQSLWCVCIYIYIHTYIHMHMHNIAGFSLSGACVSTYTYIRTYTCIYITLQASVSLRNKAHTLLVTHTCDLCMLTPQGYICMLTYVCLRPIYVCLRPMYAYDPFYCSMSILTCMYTHNTAGFSLSAQQDTQMTYACIYIYIYIYIYSYVCVCVCVCL